jgi:pimeloyl-ACP methyl ester carboxylesterase
MSKLNRARVLRVTVSMVAALGLCGCDREAIPRLEDTSCRFQVPARLGMVEGRDYACGDLILLVDRAALGGPRVRLHYLQVKGESGKASATIYLDGGPGASGQSILRALDTEMLTRLREAGDLLILAQRGTLLSRPELGCRGGESLRTCRDRISRSADLTKFNTAASADDVDALREALGYQQLNLYGISYGTRLGLEVIRRHEGSVRAAVLDGIAPPGVDWYGESPGNFYSALREFATACARHRYCGEEFGDLAATFLKGVRSLAGQSLQFEERVIDAAAYARMVFQLLYGPNSATYHKLPLVVEELASRRTARIARFLTRYFDWLSRREASLAEGLYHSVTCGELFNPPDQEAARQANSWVPVELSAALGDYARQVELCAEWPRPPEALVVREPVVAAVPVLVLSGAFDPVTPPRYGKAVADHLSNALEFVYPNSGHGASLQHSCGRHHVVAFLREPTEPLDTSCVARIELEFDADKKDHLPNDEDLLPLGPL